MGEFPIFAPAATDFAERVDYLLHTLNFLTAFFTILVGVIVLFLVIRYRKGNRVDRSRPVSHNTMLEAVTMTPLLFVALAVFFWSANLYASVFAPPPNAKEVYVVGKQWMWHLQHTNGIRENNELHLAVGEPVKLTIISQDVIHAFYVPEFRLQRHCEPGNYTTMWFTPTKPGKYHMYCNMYCGTQHSEMGGWVYVLPRDEYQKWVASSIRSVAAGGVKTPTGGLSLAQQGAALYEKFQCASCHSPEAVKRGSGPSLVGIYGKARQLADGRKVTADDAYLRNVLFYPAEHALAGWAQGMPSYKGSMSESDVVAVNAYVKSLGTAGEEPAGTLGGEAPAAGTDNQQWRFMYGGEQYK